LKTAELVASLLILIMHTIVISKIVAVVALRLSLSDLVIILMVSRVHVRVHISRAVASALIEVVVVPHIVGLSSVSAMSLRIVLILILVMSVVVISASVPSSAVFVVSSLVTISAVVLLMLLRLVFVGLGISSPLSHYLLVTESSLDTAILTREAIAIARNSMRLPHLIRLLAVKEGGIILRHTVHSWRHTSSRIGRIVSRIIVGIVVRLVSSCRRAINAGLLLLVKSALLLS